MGLFDFIPDEQSIASGLLGLSGQIRNYGNWQKQRIKSLLSDPVGYIKSGLDEQLAPIRKQAAWQRSGIDAMTGSSDTRSSLDNQVVDYAMNQAMNAPAFTVWHGSPHKFNKFDMSKIGTGEGAQAYGHGLYMAESPNVAESYQKTLSKNVRIDGKDAKTLGKSDDASALVAAFGGDVDKAIAYQKQVGATLPEIQQHILNRLEELRGKATTLGGNLYKVDIPDEAVARFLDWDKPLSQQAPEVQAAMQNIKGKFPLSNEGWDIKPFIDADPLFSTVHNAAVKELNIPADFFQKEFASQGIPGIRYLDGGSRGQQAGTSNFVLFDDNLPRILEINGSPTGLSPWKPGEWNGGLLGIGK